MKSLLSFQSQLLQNFGRAAHRQLWLDYDGSLVPFTRRPEEAAPSPELLAILSHLAKDDRNQIIVISGRDRGTLGQWLGGISLDLVAEHGAFLRRPGQAWQPFLTASLNWKARVAESLRAVTHQFEGSFLEEKEFSLVWHYREIASSIWPGEVAQIVEDLQSHETVVYQEACSLEVRSRGIDKGRFFKESPWRSRRSDFGLVLGDGNTDEDLFKQAPQAFYTVRVGFLPGSAARYYLPLQLHVLPFLSELAALTHTPGR
ncbi:MAG: trehalose-phosphatase [Cyclobacteriaceae bacterium]|nr:trehalose-phosphatase [Cyclobacteriaceae bacterium]